MNWSLIFPLFLTLCLNDHTTYKGNLNVSSILLQVEIANKYVNYHAKQFGYSKPNTDFKLGKMERLSEVGIQDNSMDIIM